MKPLFFDRHKNKHCTVRCGGFWRHICSEIEFRLIRTFSNRCLSAIGGGNQWSRFAGWVQLSAEADWPLRSAASATLCAQATMRLMIMIYNAGNLHKLWPCNDMVFGLQCGFLNHNDVLIIGTYFFLMKGMRKTTTDTKMDKKGVWILNVYIISASILIKWFPVRFTHNGDFPQWIWSLYPIQSLPLLLMIWQWNGLGPISPVAPPTSMD